MKWYIPKENRVGYETTVLQALAVIVIVIIWMVIFVFMAGCKTSSSKGIYNPNKSKIIQPDPLWSPAEQRRIVTDPKDDPWDVKQIIKRDPLWSKDANRWIVEEVK